MNIKEFPGVLKKLATKRKKEDDSGEVFVVAVIRHESFGEIQHFLDPLQLEFSVQSIRGLFNSPVIWSRIVLDLEPENLCFFLEFDEHQIEVQLMACKVARKIKRGVILYSFDLEFEFPFSRDSDLFLSYYLNKKEETESGKKQLVEYPVSLQFVND